MTRCSLEKINGNLKITRTGDFRPIEQIRDAEGINAALLALLEHHLANGWEMVPPKDLGALTSAPILSDEIERDEDGQITAAGRVYWYPDYAVRDEIQELREKISIVFQGVE